MIIPVFNKPEYTQACLDSLLVTDPGTNLRPIIVDNGSRTKTRRLLERWIKDARERPFLSDPRIVANKENFGFAGALNRAINESRDGELAMIMHNDCIPFKGWAREMLDCLELHEDDDVIAVAPRTNYANEMRPCLPGVRERFEGLKFPNKDRVAVDQIDGLMRELYPEDQDAFLTRLRDDPRTSYLPEICSFCLLVRKQALRDVPFDEDFWPRFFEDKLWFLHHERQGCACMLSNWSYVHHFGNITSDGPGFSMPDLFAMNEKKFKEKVRVLNERPFGQKETKPDVAVHNDMHGAP